MAISWYPLQPGELFTAEKINELVAAIQDGSVFTSVSFVSSLVTTLDTRVSSLEAQVALLNQTLERTSIRQQFVMAAGQNVVTLTQAPILDSEWVSLNGMSLAKSGVPVGYSADYSINGTTLTLTNELALQVQADDVLVVKYDYYTGS